MQSSESETSRAQITSETNYSARRDTRRDTRRQMESTKQYATHYATRDTLRHTMMNAATTTNVYNQKEQKTTYEIDGTIPTGRMKREILRNKKNTHGYHTVGRACREITAFAAAPLARMMCLALVPKFKPAHSDAVLGAPSPLTTSSSRF